MVVFFLVLVVFFVIPIIVGGSWAINHGTKVGQRVNNHMTQQEQAARMTSAYIRQKMLEDTQKRNP